MYDFLLNMWIMKRINEDYLTKMVNTNPPRITEQEKQMILTTTQM